jgi:hypothetical protein
MDEKEGTDWELSSRKELEVLSHGGANLALRRLNDGMQNLMDHFQAKDRKAKWQLFLDARNENFRLWSVANQKQEQVRTLQGQLRAAEQQHWATTKQVEMNELAGKQLQEL